MSNYFILKNNKYSYNTKLILGCCLITFFLYLYTLTSDSKDNKEKFTNIIETKKDDEYSNINNKNTDFKNTVSNLTVKLNETIKTIKEVPDTILSFSKDLLNIYKFIVLISKFLLKFTDKVDQITKGSDKLKDLWKSSETHREYIQMRVKKNMALWDKCLVPDNFNKRFKECKEAYEDTKKFENYLKNNYPKFKSYINKNGGPNDTMTNILNTLDMKELNNLLNGINIKELEKKFAK